MKTKNAKAINHAESEHMAKVKAASCVLCDAPGPSEAHHVKQGDHFATVAVCPNCHRGPYGIHGDKTMQRIRKYDEIDMINETLRRVMA